MKKDLADVCTYLKTIVVPHTPENFTVAEPFRHGLPNDELLLGIASFRSFLYRFFNVLAANKDKVDVQSGAKFDPVNTADSIHKCFPFISEIALILFLIGTRGKLRTKPQAELVVSGKDMLIPLPPKTERFYSLGKISSKREFELFRFLTGFGFSFDGLEVSERIDFSKTETFAVRYERDNSLIIGLKLLAEAQENIQFEYHKFASVFLRGDFYSLANATQEIHDINCSEFVKSQHPEVGEWVVEMDKLLSAKCCDVAREVNNFTSNGHFTYTLWAGRQYTPICRIDVGMLGSALTLKKDRLADQNNILCQIPETAANALKKTSRTFSLDDPTERILLKQWIEAELSFLLQRGAVTKRRYQY